MAGCLVPPWTRACASPAPAHCSPRLPTSQARPHRLHGATHGECEKEEGSERACLPAGRCNSRVGHAVPTPPSPPAPAPQTSSAAAERAALRAPRLSGRASAMRLCGSSAPRTGVGRTKPQTSHMIVTHDRGRRRKSDAALGITGSLPGKSALATEGSPVAGRANNDAALSTAGYSPTP